MSPPTLRSTCRACGAPIVWLIVEPEGRSVPLDADYGGNHVELCPHPEHYDRPPVES